MSSVTSFSDTCVYKLLLWQKRLDLKFLNLIIIFFLYIKCTSARFNDFYT